MAYVGNMLSIITTGDEVKDMESIDVVADSVHARAMDIHQEYLKHLEGNRKLLHNKIEDPAESAGTLANQRQQLESLIEESKASAPKREQVVEALKTVRAEFL